MVRTEGEILDASLLQDSCFHSDLKLRLAEFAGSSGSEVRVLSEVVSVGSYLL